MTWTQPQSLLFNLIFFCMLTLWQHESSMQVKKTLNYGENASQNLLKVEINFEMPKHEIWTHHKSQIWEMMSRPKPDMNIHVGSCWVPRKILIYFDFLTCSSWQPQGLSF